MSASAHTDGRLEREADFHDRWANEIDVSTALVDEAFTAVTALENAHVLKVFGDVRGLSILDYGCGAAEAGVYLAKLGARVVGVDVSGGMLDAARGLARHHGVTIETRQVTSAQIPAERGEFDRIYGNGVLHHVDMDLAVPELARVMKPEAIACFIEPLSYNPAIALYRRLAEAVRTPDERPLRFRDIERFEPHFTEVSHREFWLTSLAIFAKFFAIDHAHPSKERYWKKVITDAPANEWWFRPLPRIDETILRLVPPLSAMCWNTVIRAARPRPYGAP
jgi:2-polyprenyl-3-methyl-5-hydroxy-6-metoxy-1,4-benzoquinol methylase